MRNARNGIGVIGLAVVLAVPTAVTGATPNLADGFDEPADEAVIDVDEVLAVIDQQTPDTSPDIAPDVRTWGDAIISTDQNTLSIVSGDGSALFVSDETLPAIIRLPELDDLGEATIIDDGALVASTEDVAFVAHPVEGGGIKTSIVIETPEAPTEYHFELVVPQDTQYEFFEDGSFLASLPDGTWVGGFSAPWAYDASGVEVPTHYLVSDTGVTQVVDHLSGAYDYPIIADPCWSCFLDGIAVVGGLVIAVATAVGVCVTFCAVVGVVFAVYSAGRWIQTNYRSCQGKKRVNPWREVYWGCRR